MLVPNGSGEWHFYKNSGEEKKDMANENVSDHRALFHLKKGGLHNALGIAKNEEIPEEKKRAALNSTNPHVRKMAQFAVNAEKFHH